ncbi:hypothetical protein PHISCL_06428 [Aspergillus sclerotialis]|uniref:Uncharacterized protein n=1 Tax=Aspergillus sclerotialis TaxID=2070753 RepID=A0A3A2ZE86_9EURO|nr:hypothetical protein PHISCL_06428 [Aspergillus sclerotialis]
MHYYIFGQNISQSKSPALHNAAFAAHNLPHDYSIRDCSSMTGVEALIRSNPEFGGASVTMPHKLSVHRYCDYISDAALQIGAINTLVVRHDQDKTGEQRKRTIHGENTDWSGLYALIARYPLLREMDNEPVGVVVGAGGAARAAVYAMARAGITNICVWNRTVGKAEKIASDFGALCKVTVVAHAADIPYAPDVIIGTIPGDVLSVEAFRGLFAKEKGLCIEMSYKPSVTNLLSVAREHGGWVTADGLEVLLQQAFDQSKLWTGKEAPQEIMRRAIDGGNAGLPTSANAQQRVAGNTGNVRI